MAVDRDFAIRLLNEYVPQGEKSGLVYHSKFFDSDPRHNEMINRFLLPDCKSEYREFAGIGTTCGYLCQWLLFRLGVNNTNLLNRTTFRAGVRPNKGDFDDFSHMSIYGYGLPNKRITKDEFGKSIHAKPADDGIHFQTFFEIGLNLSKIYNYKQAFQPVTCLEDLKMIRRGDIGLIRGSNKVEINFAWSKLLQNENPVTVSEKDTSHVFVFKDILSDNTNNSEINKRSISFYTVEGGQNQQGFHGLDVVQKYREFFMENGKVRVRPDFLSDRVLLGYLNLDLIADTDLGAPIKNESWPEKDLYNYESAHIYYSYLRYSSSSISTMPFNP